MIICQQKINEKKKKNCSLLHDDLFIIWAPTVAISQALSLLQVCQYSFFNFLFYTGAQLTNNVVTGSGGQQRNSAMHVVNTVSWWDWTVHFRWETLVCFFFLTIIVWTQKKPVILTLLSDFRSPNSARCRTEKSNRSDLHLHYFTVIPFTSHALDALLHVTFHFLHSPCLPSNDVELRYITGKTAELLDALKKNFF